MLKCKLNHKEAEDRKAQFSNEVKTDLKSDLTRRANE